MAWRCENCGHQNVVDGFACLRCNFAPKGLGKKFDKKPSAIFRSLKGLFSGLVVLAISGAVAYAFVANQQGKAAVKTSCTEVGQQKMVGELGSDSSGEVDYSPGTSSDYAVTEKLALDNVGVAGLFVNDADSTPQRSRDLDSALSAVIRAELETAKQTTYQNAGSSVQVNFLTFGSSGCSEVFADATKGILHAAADRLRGSETLVSEPGGGVVYRYSENGSSVSHRLIFSKASYVVLIVANDEGAARQLATTYASALPG